MPANTGVNPSLSITALAERALSLLPNKGELDPRPPLDPSVQEFLPGGAFPEGYQNTFLFDARVYYPEMTTVGGRFYQEYMKVALRDVLLEDMSTLEDVQAACETGVKTHMVLQDYEIMVRHQYEVMRRLTGWQGAA